MSGLQKLVLVVVVLPLISLAAPLRGVVKTGPTLELKSLDPRDPQLRAWRSEIFYHHKSVRTIQGRGAQVGKSRPLQLEPLKYAIYRVKKADSFFQIMARTGLDPDTLANVNQLVSVHSLSPGQKLKIPNYRGILYEPEKKETLAKVAGRFQLPVEFLRFLNRKPFYTADGSKAWFLPGAKLSPSERKYFKGKAFIHPLPGARVTSRFGMRRHPLTKRQSFHSGVDLAAAKGSDVVASGTGRVIFAGRRGHYGNLVILKHKHGYHTYYGHLSKINVRRGQRVRQGQTIGLVGATGRATGPHLHFETRRLGKAKSPLTVLRHR